MFFFPIDICYVVVFCSKRYRQFRSSLINIYESYPLEKLSPIQGWITHEIRTTGVYVKSGYRKHLRGVLMRVLLRRLRDPCDLSGRFVLDTIWAFIDPGEHYIDSGALSRLKMILSRLRKLFWIALSWILGLLKDSESFYEDSEGQ